MKSLLLSLSLFSACLAAPSLAQTTSGSGGPHFYLNESLGFNVEGYNYAQDEYPCDIDTALVERIVERATSKSLQVEATRSAEKIRSGETPVLAIDIESLVLGSEDRTFGTKSDSNLPSVRVTAALVNTDTEEGFTTAKHSCAIATLNELTPSSNILDLGGTHTVCSATHKCLDDLSKDIVQWVAPQIR